MYETEALWRSKRKGSTSPGLGGVLAWLLRIGAIGGVGIVCLLVFLNVRESIAPIGTIDASRDYGEEASAAEGIDRELILRRSSNGHFHVTAYVQGVPIPFLVDTGATDVALSADAARQIGINMRTLNYSRRYQTANGQIKAAPVVLRDIRIGDLRVYDVQASVTQTDLGISLLGMSFLNRLSSFEANGKELILRW